MRIVRFDSVGGASGDMLLGALIGLGLDAAELERELARLLPGHFHLEVTPKSSWAIAGISAHVVCEPEDHLHHGHEHGDGGGDTNHDHHHHEHHHHDHHAFREIRALIENSELPEAVRTMSVAVFALLAEAEGAIHGKPADEVCFHEVGAVDSIVDIVGCCLAYHRLGLDGISVSPVPTGTGTVHCQHGCYPVPAPATAEILKHGLAIAPCDEASELLTPTGAALLSAWPKREIPAGGRVAAVANAFGQRELKSRPNLLRAMLFESSPAATPSAEVQQAELIECNLDDAPGELLGNLLELLLKAGALDAWYEPLVMKKQRPGVKLGVLTTPDRRDQLIDLVFAESTTFGVRILPVERQVLEREFIHVETAWGAVEVKLGRRNGRIVAMKPEYETCRSIAASAGVPLKTVLAAALAAVKL